MLEFVFQPFQVNCTQLIIDNYSKSNTLLIFPTQANASQVQRALQKDWQFNTLKCISMDEFKRVLFLPAKPVLEDQKRYIALYCSLSQEAKDLFNCNSYQESVSFANSFFSFFEELRDEEIIPETIAEILSSKLVETSPWQLTHLDRLIEIKQSYKVYIKNKGLTDKIFLLDSYIDTYAYSYDKIVFVNQVYYSGLERRIIKELSSKISVELLFFGSEKYFDKSSYQVLRNDYIDRIDSSKINITLTDNETSMNQAFCEDVSLGKLPDSIVYLNYEDSFSSNMLSEKYFNLPVDNTFTHSRLYRFVNTLSVLLKGIIYYEQLELIKINCLIDTLSEDAFTEYFGFESLLLIKELTKLIDDGFIYLDLNVKRCKRWIDSSLLLDFLNEIGNLIISLKSLNSIEKLVTFMTHRVNPEKILNDWELKYSNAISVFYEGLANFRTIDEFSIVDSWTQFVDGNKRLIAPNLISLLLENLSSRKIKFGSKIDTKRSKYHNFLDTRNASYNSIAILNLKEGLLPGRRNQPYLFTDVQRKALGMKTFEVIQAREKYYFYRLLTASDVVYLYGLKNSDNGTEVSSFIDELVVNFTDIKVKRLDSDSSGHTRNLQSLCKTKSNWAQSSTPLDNSFARFDFNQDDLPLYNNKYLLSFTAFSALYNCPFKYYLENICKQREMTKRSEENFGALMFGRFIHILMSRIVKRLNDTYSGYIKHKPEWFNHQYVETTINTLMDSNSKEYYGIPQSVGKFYFEKVVKPILSSSILAFFTNMEEKHEIFSSMKYRFVPEEENTSDLTTSPEPIITFKADKVELPVYLVGKADLRIEDKEVCLIVDYKTGRDNPFMNYQLIMYKSVYEQLLNKTTIPLFWYFRENKLKEPGNKRTSIEDIITDCLDSLFHNGFEVKRLSAYDEDHIDALSRFKMIRSRVGEQ